jgi:hypothetical protein
MKVAYILNTPNAANYKLGDMILPQIEKNEMLLEYFFSMIIALYYKKTIPKVRGCLR